MKTPTFDLNCYENLNFDEDILDLYCPETTDFEENEEKINSNGSQTTNIQQNEKSSFINVSSFDPENMFETNFWDKDHLQHPENQTTQDETVNDIIFQLLKHETSSKQTRDESTQNKVECPKNTNSLTQVDQISAKKAESSVLLKDKRCHSDKTDRYKQNTSRHRHHHHESHEHTETCHGDKDWRKELFKRKRTEDYDRQSKQKRNLQPQQEHNRRPHRLQYRQKQTEEFRRSKEQFPFVSKSKPSRFRHRQERQQQTEEHKLSKEQSPPVVHKFEPPRFQHHQKCQQRQQQQTKENTLSKLQSPLICCKLRLYAHPYCATPNVPKRGETGYDIVALRHQYFSSGDIHSVLTGFGLQLPSNMYARIILYPEFSKRNNCIILNEIITSNKMSEIFVKIMNLNDKYMIIKQGELFAYMIFQKYEDVNFSLEQNVTCFTFFDKQ